ncbi:uncharacterized protein O3C94_013624 isoform 1-T1 [Discoglossus pictus]
MRRTAPSNLSSSLISIQLPKMLTSLMILLLIVPLSQGQTAGPLTTSEVDEKEVSKDALTTAMYNTTGAEEGQNVTGKMPTLPVNGTDGISTELNDTSAANSSQSTISQGVTTKDTTVFTPTEHTKGVTTTTIPPAKPTRDAETIRREHAARFIYDYDSLIKWGLICSFILFVTGFLVLFGGKFTKCSCRRKQKRKYKVVTEYTPVVVG